jgi:gag-polypeptide of LTR copia-type
MQNPNAEEDQEELQPHPMNQKEFNSSEEVQTRIQKEENASSLLMSVLGDDIVNDLMNELGDPVAMWNVLKNTYSSKSGTNIVTTLNGVVTKKLGRNERMSTHIGHLNSLFHQLTNIPGNDEGKDCTRKDLTITGDIFKICMLWHPFLMLENMMQLLKQFEACLMKTERRTTELSKTDSLSRLVKNIPRRDQSLETNVFNLDITTWKVSTGHVGQKCQGYHHVLELWQKRPLRKRLPVKAEYQRQIKHFQSEAHEGQKAVHPSHQKTAS